MSKRKPVWTRRSERNGNHEGSLPALQRDAQRLGFALGFEADKEAQRVACVAQPLSAEVWARWRQVRNPGPHPIEQPCVIAEWHPILESSRDAFERTGEVMVRMLREAIKE